MANSSKTTGSLSQPDESTPYVGPRPFTRDDQDIFFGRNQEAIELTSLVKAHPEVLLYAQSGAGKTSLLFAQVIPILDLEEEFDVLPPARVRSQESSAIPQNQIDNIYMFNAFKDLSDDKLSPPERAQLTLPEYLERLPRPPVKSAQSSAGDSIEDLEVRLPRVVIFDQFEEIFTLYPERYKDRQDFFSQVAAALAADPFLRVIFSMREDYIAEFDPYVDTLPQNLRTRFRLERLRKANALSAVKQPLETDRVKGRRHFAPGAAELLVERLMLIRVKTATGERIEVPGEFVDPVQLQVVCQTLWKKLPPEKEIITKEDLDKYADVDEALLNFYEASVQKSVTTANDAIQAGATQSAQPIALITEGVVRGWFEQKLITRDGKRNMVFREGDMTAGLSNLAVDELDNQHVIRVEMRGGEPWYELSHDRFIPPIRESNRRFMLNQPLAQRKAQELEARADDWLKAQRSVTLLLNRTELLDAQDWMNSEAAAIGFSETLFSLVRASEVAIEHEDNKQQQMLAEAQRRSMIAERQRSRQMKIGLVVASLLLVCALGSTAYAFMANGKANRAARQAEYEKMLAQVQRKRAEDVAGKLTIANAEADAQRIEANKQSRIAIEQKEIAERARTLAEKSQKAAEQAKALLQVALADTKEAGIKLAQKNSDLELKKEELKSAVNLAWSLKLAENAESQLPTDPELALRLALEAVSSSDTEPAKNSLRQAYVKSTERSILRGHTEEVWQAVYSPDGKFIFTASNDGTVKMWDAKEHRQLKTFQGDEGQVHAIAISADGTHIVTEAEQKGRLWNVSDGSSIVMDGLTGPVAAIAFSPNGKWVATEATSDDADDDKIGATPRIWDVDHKAIRQTLKGHARAISALAFSPASDRLATASWDNTARIWDVATGRSLTVLSGHTAPLDSVAFDPTGQFVATGSYDGTARVWDVATGREIRALKGHTGGVRAADFSPDGKLILTVGQRVTSLNANNNQIPLPADMPVDEAAPLDNTVRVWDAKSGDPLTVITEPTSEINLAVFSDDSSIIATATKDGTVRVWETATGKEITKFLGHSGNVNSIAFSPNGKFVLTAGEDHTTQVWKVANSTRPARPVGDGAGKGASKQYVQFDPTGESIISAGTTGGVLFQNLTGKVRAGGLSPLPGLMVNDIAISPDGKYAVTASRRPRQTRSQVQTTDRDAHIWDLTSNKLDKDLIHPVPVKPAAQATPAAPGKPAPGKPAPTAPALAEQVRKVMYSPKGNYILTVTGDGTARVWNALKGTVEQELKPGEAAKGLGIWAFDPSERYLVTADATGDISVWEISTGKNKPIIRTEDTAIHSLAINDQGDLMVVARSDSTAQVWTPEGKYIATLSGHTGDVRSAQFSRDGNFIVTAAEDGTVRVWDVETWRTISVNKIQENVRVATASFSPDGKSIVVGDDRGVIYVLDCEECHPFGDILKLANGLEPRQLTPDEKARFEPGKPSVQGP
jgi:WD40 repeat protein